jgi:hypothetical protein
MTDPVQIILLVVIVVFTVLLVVLGIQVFYILKELRNSIIKVNKVLDDAGTISESVANPVSALSAFVTGIQSGNFVSTIKFFKKFFSSPEEEPEHKRRSYER